MRYFGDWPLGGVIEMFASGDTPSSSASASLAEIIGHCASWAMAIGTGARAMSASRRRSLLRSSSELTPLPEPKNSKEIAIESERTAILTPMLRGRDSVVMRRRYAAHICAWVYHGCRTGSRSDGWRSEDLGHCLRA